MKALRAILLLLIIALFASGCATEHGPVTDGQGEEPSVSETGGAPVGTQPGPAVLNGEEPVKPYVPAKGAGSAKELVGDNFIISILVEGTQSKIDAQMEAEILENTRKAADWLEAEAQKRGKTARFITGKEDGELVLRYQYAGSIADLITDAITDPFYDYYDLFNYDDALLMMQSLELGVHYSRIKEQYPDANIAVMLFYNECGRSFAIPSTDLEPPESMLTDNAQPTDFTYMDVCVVLEKQVLEVVAYNPYIIAHELLHLYGAVDLYYLCSQNPREDAMEAEKAILAGSYFPWDIMFHHTSEELGIPNEISDLTAYLIGWEETVPVKYVYFLYKTYR